MASVKWLNVEINTQSNGSSAGLSLSVKHKLNILFRNAENGYAINGYKPK
jgi:hypothetical protein